jgi:hypothetical protein
MFNTDATKWAELVFGSANLGDPRRTKRLVKLASDIASNAAQSLVKASADPASIEGAYRFIRNNAITPESIAQAGFIHTASVIAERPQVLAIQDSSGLSYKHSVCNELGSVSSANKRIKNSKGRSLYVHSTLMLDAQTEQILGLGNQHYWYREDKVGGTKSEQQNRNRKEKESYKWQRNIEQLTQRLGSLANIIDVCDREADIYEYMEHQISHGNRFVVRSYDDRILSSSKGKLSDAINATEPCAHYPVDIRQKGGRLARKAKIALSYTRVSLKKPERATGAEEITLNVVICQEIGKEHTREKLRWVLYTTEAIINEKDARKIARYYELRWRIEEFHKVWKSDGTQVESLRMQSRENLERIAVVLAFVAVRLLQLRDINQNNIEAEKTPCTVYLGQLSWNILWKITHKNEALPDEPPSLSWAYYSIAKLGGWYDSKRTGRVGVKALWHGWLKLMEIVESYEMIKGLDL